MQSCIIYLLAWLSSKCIVDVQKCTGGLIEKKITSSSLHYEFPNIIRGLVSYTNLDLLSQRPLVIDVREFQSSQILNCHFCYKRL
ncbi:hypothetical protein BJV82DRAFT_610095 [Fennellomyces sp. T-0311]|nr:hypothetical protein BJV82DRAFT_610095 [Fennellomyces sp. T-0311]